MIGQTLSHYRVLEEISRGGMGIVYRALDLKLDREVALKVLPPELVADPERKRRFVQEAKAAAKLNHPHIGMVFEIDDADGTTFIAMELIEGEKLKDLINKERLPLTRALELATEVAEGLARAHDKGIVHRDLKPANIMVTEDGHAKIIDFGLAKLMEPLSGEGSEVETAIRGETEPGKVMGTVSYMSPEQAGGKTIDHRSDIFTFGVVLYEMLTGKPPFQGPTGIDILHAILRDSAPRLPVLGSEAPDESAYDIQHIVDKCLAKDPGKRYQGMKDLVVDLRGARRLLDSRRAEQATSPLGTSHSIAVLPFADMSPQKDQEYFCEGMAEEIINALTKVEGLRVAARTSAFQFEGKAKDARQIGEALNVKALLEGSVRTAGDRLRVTAQLINVADGYHLWSDRYEKKMEDVFSIQDEITSRIVEALKIRLLSPKKSPLVKTHPNNMEAYHLYLKGRHYRLSRYDIGKAREFFEQAVREDPSYAPAYAGLTDCYNHLGRDGFLPPNLARSKAKEAAIRALFLDDSLGEAHSVLAFTRSFLDWEWRDAEREFKRAIELDPACTSAYYWYGMLLAILGRQEEALTMARTAEELDPLAPVARMAVAGMHLSWGDYDGSASVARKVLEMHPDHPLGLAGLGLSQSLLSRHEPAISALEKTAALVARPPLMLAWLGRAYAVAGRREQALEIAGELKDREYVAPLFQAWIYGGLRAKEEAFKWLAMAFEERSPWLAFCNITRAMFHEDLRSDSRFAKLARRTKLSVIDV